MIEPAYFADGSEAMLALEAMVDKVGVRDVLYALARISYTKAEHIQSNWQDERLASKWTKQGLALDRFTAMSKALRGYGL